MPKQLFSLNNVFLAHCAGYAKGVGDEFTDSLSPLCRLEYVIVHKPEISCSTIALGDSFANCNFTGTLGLIIDPVNYANITHSSPTDGGTLPTGTGLRTRTNGKNSASDITDAITNRSPTGYNEICVKNYNVIGVFVTPQISFATGESYSTKTIYDIFGKRLRFFLLNNSISEMRGHTKHSLTFNQIY